MSYDNAQFRGEGQATESVRLTEAERACLAETVGLHKSARAVAHGDGIAWVCEGCAQPLVESDPSLAFADLAGHQVAEQIATVEAILRARAYPPGSQGGAS